MSSPGKLPNSRRQKDLGLKAKSALGTYQSYYRSTRSDVRKIRSVPVNIAVDGCRTRRRVGLTSHENDVASPLSATRVSSNQTRYSLLSCTFLQDYLVCLITTVRSYYNTRVFVYERTVPRVRYVYDPTHRILKYVRVGECVIIIVIIVMAIIRV